MVKTPAEQNRRIMGGFKKGNNGAMVAIARPPAARREHCQFCGTIIVACVDRDREPLHLSAEHAPGGSMMLVRGMAHPVTPAPTGLYEVHSCPT